MPTEGSPSSALDLSPQATVAQLRLQLRASLSEAVSAEAGEVDLDAALARVRARLAVLIEARRRTLEEALELARAESAAAVTDALREASAIIAEASSPLAKEMAEVLDVEETVRATDQVAVVAPTTIVIDAEAFGRVVATVLGEHLSSWSVGAHPSPPPTPAKRFFWAQARHLDVLLVVLATVIVLVILASWWA